MFCIVKWFQTQEGASSCPCCRKEAGEHDNVPIYDEDEEDYEEDEYDSDASDVSDVFVRTVWHCRVDGTWVRTYVVEDDPLEWRPMDADEMPASLVNWLEDSKYSASKIQSAWRGYRVRLLLKQAM